VPPVKQQEPNFGRCGEDNNCPTVPHPFFQYISCVIETSGCDDTRSPIWSGAAPDCDEGVMKAEAAAVLRPRQ